MKYLNKLASLFFIGALGVLTMTSCEGGDLYNVGAPGWLSEMGGEEEEPEPEEELVGQMEDVYNIGKEDLSSGFWTLGKTYVVPAGAKWQAQFNLTVNPDNKYFKNFYLVLNRNDETLDGAVNEYGVIRFDNDPTKNSEWNTTSQVNPNGTEIDRSLVGGNFTNSSPTEGEDQDVDANAQKMNGKITLTVDRTDGGLFIKMTNGTLTKTYTQTTPFPSTGADAPIACRIGIEGSLVSFISTNIEPIGGCTSASDKQPVSMVLKGVPSKVLLGTDQETLIAGVTAEVTFEELPAPIVVKSEDLKFEVIPSLDDLGTKTLVAAYGKTYKGASADKPIIAYASFSVVEKLFTCIGKTDNTSGFREEATENFKVAPGQTYVNYFTNYTDGVNNWDNFIIQLCKSDGTEYCFVRADNWGLGGSYWEGCQSCDWDWGNFKEILNGAKVTTYITNNGDGTADIKAVVVGSDGNTYTQKYTGLKNIDPNDMCFNLSMEKGHLEFDYVIGAEDNTSGFRAIATPNIKIEAGQTFVNRFINAGDGAANWNNFIIQLCKGDGTEYCFVRADNWGLGGSYWEGCQSCDYNWEIFASIMDGAKVTTYITNNGDGTADIKAVVEATDGKIYTQNYKGLNNIDSNDLYYNLSMEKAHLVFE
ncbi:MAG: hypothetical protein IJ540_05200 [Prevotella sp.]|nr:hypothetical protein [Prevotella sp.]